MFNSFIAISPTTIIVVITIFTCQFVPFLFSSKSSGPKKARVDAGQGILQLLHRKSFCTYTPANTNLDKILRNRGVSKAPGTVLLCVD